MVLFFPSRSHIIRVTLLAVLGKGRKIYKLRNLHIVNINHFLPYSKSERESKFVPLHIIQTYGGVEILLHTFAK